MCGIVGGVATRDIEKVLINGLRRLEYRGYDSAGIAVITHTQTLTSHRAVGKVANLAAQCETDPLHGRIGIAHTRWATHGPAHERNAHPLVSQGNIAVVHNGIIENFESLQAELKAQGYSFSSDTDTESIAHYLHSLLNSGHSLIQAMVACSEHLTGVYAIVAMFEDYPDRLYALSRGCPLVVGLGIEENFIASDQVALLPVSQRFIYLQDGDIAEIRQDQVQLFSAPSGEPISRPVYETELTIEATERGRYRHFMLKEIHEQPTSVQATIANYLLASDAEPFINLATQLKTVINHTKRLQLVGCGTSYHAALVGRFWFEGLAQLPTQVEVASELRYRKTVVEEGCVLLGISQSGETLDTLAAMRAAKDQGYFARIAITNAAQSAMSREVENCLLTIAGIEIGVASTKAFTTQLTMLFICALVYANARGTITTDQYLHLIACLQQLPYHLEKILLLEPAIQELARLFAHKSHTIFLGRGIQYPIALEGALKLKEISYIHAEGYPAGELKHGPLALVDEDMPVVAIALNDELIDKVKANLKEVQARGAELVVFTDDLSWKSSDRLHVIHLPSVHSLLAPICSVMVLQLLAYHVAVLKGTDIDQPRNLAKSVTVE